MQNFLAHYPGAFPRSVRLAKFWEGQFSAGRQFYFVYSAKIRIAFAGGPFVRSEIGTDMRQRPVSDFCQT